MIAEVNVSCAEGPCWCVRSGRCRRRWWARPGGLTPVAGVALWGPLLDRLNVVAEADRRGLRPIGAGGYTGGECYRALVETLLAGGDFLSDRALLADPATAALRGVNALPSVSTLWRFLAGAGLGRVAKAAAVNR